jgi:hypothetical protein
VAVAIRPVRRAVMLGERGIRACAVRLSVVASIDTFDYLDERNGMAPSSDLPAIVTAPIDDIEHLQMFASYCAFACVLECDSVCVRARVCVTLEGIVIVVGLPAAMRDENGVQLVYDNVFDVRPRDAAGRQRRNVIMGVGDESDTAIATVRVPLAEYCNNEATHALAWLPDMPHVYRVACLVVVV